MGSFERPCVCGRPRPLFLGSVELFILFFILLRGSPSSFNSAAVFGATVSGLVAAWIGDGAPSLDLHGAFASLYFFMACSFRHGPAGRPPGNSSIVMHVSRRCFAG